MPRRSRPISVTLGDLHERVETRVKAGTYASASEVLRAAVRALDREEAARVLAHAADRQVAERAFEAASGIARSGGSTRT